MRVHLLPGLMIVGVAFMCVSVPVVAQNSDADSANSDKAWSATGESSYTSGVNNVRTSESHAKSGDRTVDKQSLQRVGPDGRYENFMDVETETVKMNATTTKTMRASVARFRRQILMATSMISPTDSGRRSGTSTASSVTSPPRTRRRHRNWRSFTGIRR